MLVVGISWFVYRRMKQQKMKYEEDPRSSWGSILELGNPVRYVSMGISMQSCHFDIDSMKNVSDNGGSGTSSVHSVGRSSRDRMSRLRLLLAEP